MTFTLLEPSTSRPAVQAAVDAAAVTAGGAAGESDRWWRRSIGKRLQHVQTSIGIEIGEQEVHITTMRSSSHPGNEPAWIGRFRFPLPESTEQSITTDWLESVFDEIDTRLPRCIDGDTNVTAISLPNAWTHYQTVLGHELAETREKCNAMFLESVFASPARLCHWPVVGAHHGKPSAEDRYVIAATPEYTACRIADLLYAKNYEVQSILPQGVVLAHAAATLTSVDAQCVIWLNDQSALIAVRHRSGVGLVRTLPSVPDHLLQLDQPDRPLDAHTLRPFLSAVATEFRSTARYAARADMSPMTKQPILIAGPLAEIQGVDEIVATLCETPVAVWSYCGTKRPATPARFAKQDGECVRRLDASFAVALSLTIAAANGSSRGYVR